MAPEAYIVERGIIEYHLKSLTLETPGKPQLLKRLTEAVVEKLKPDPKRRIEIHDALVSGLRLRITPHGKKSWSLMYKVAGQAIDGKRGPNKRITLGSYPLVGLKKARELSHAAKDLADRGIDPIEHRKSEISGRHERRVDRVIEQFIELYAKPTTKKWRDTKRILETYVAPQLGSLDISMIDRASIHDLLDQVIEKKSMAMAREVRKHLSTMFNWSLDRGICSFNPMSGMKRKDLQYVPRERILAIEELNAIWQATAKLGYPFGPITQLLMLSGQRRSEIAKLKREWIYSGYFEIPADKYKTGVNHITPLTKTMSDILAAQPVWNAGSYVFSATGGKTPSSGFSKVKKKIDGLSGVRDWTFHDIRRSVSTHMAGSEIIKEHIERVLGHKIPGVAGTYNRYSYFDEKLRALNIWEGVLADVVVNLSNTPLLPPKPRETQTTKTDTKN